MVKTFFYIDLFAGCGGLSLGLHQAEWKGLFAIERNADAFKTLKYNLIETKNHFSWVKWLDPKNHDINEVLENHSTDLKTLRGNVDLIVGGPPCQGFSMAGQRKEQDLRNKLIFSYIEFVKLVQPKLILFENVRGFTMKFDKQNEEAKPYSEIVVEELEKLGYNVEGNVLNFGNYGVPQRRNRFILAGVHQGEKGTAKHFFELLEQEKPLFLEEKGLCENTSAGEAISDLLSKNGTTICPDAASFSSGLYGKIETNLQKQLRSTTFKKAQIPDSHRFAKHNKETIEGFEKLIKKAAKGKRIDKEILRDFGIKKRGLAVLDPNQKSPTLTTIPDDLIHYCEPRILTVREYARLQTFPDFYEFKGKYTTGGHLRKVDVPRYTQIGNAIPPLFGELAGRVLKKMLE
jgi:DNA (cytosine-5)-methyltransferase 1